MPSAFTASPDLNLCAKQNKRTELAQPGEQKATRFDFQSVSEEGTFEGYASLFGKEDLGRDIVEPGAFKKSLAKRNLGQIKMLFQHDPREPIGVWNDIREDHRGLYVTGRLLLDVARAREVLSLMKAGALDGLSIGFHTVKASNNRRAGTRHLTEVDLWEISIVTFPMLPEARVHGVKRDTRMRTLPTERELERWLTRDAGFSRTQARTIIGQGYKALATRRDAGQDADKDEAALVTFLRQAADRLNINRNG